MPSSAQATDADVDQPAEATRETYERPLYESGFTPVVVGELTAGAEWH